MCQGVHPLSVEAGLPDVLCPTTTLWTSARPPAPVDGHRIPALPDGVSGAGQGVLPERADSVPGYGQGSRRHPSAPQLTARSRRTPQATGTTNQAASSHASRRPRHDDHGGAAAQRPTEERWPRGNHTRGATTSDQCRHTVSAWHPAFRSSDSASAGSRRPPRAATPSGPPTGTRTRRPSWAGFRAWRC